MDFVWKLYGNTYAVHVTVALVGVAILNLALPAPPVPGQVGLYVKWHGTKFGFDSYL